ncbi:MAG: hypothetical protein FJ387_08075 [Verrucomicrobia bacterium]|nr:hypothetical protein [Verrucomicrobiota bacterium]
MNRLSPELRNALLDGLAEMGGAGQADREPEQMFGTRFLPVPEHLRALAPEVTLIVGERGAGKSELFRLLQQPRLLLAVVQQTPQVRVTPLAGDRTVWRTAYPSGADFPDQRGLRGYLGDPNLKPETPEEFWLAYLVRCLKQELEADDRAALRPLLSPMGGDVESVMTAFHQARSAPLLALDRVDEQLRANDRWVFVAYDELDTLGGYHWEVMGRAIRGLISFWSAYSRRWSRLRAKLFMRTDLYRRNSATLSADLPKLAANRAELAWSDRNLYALLVKRMANSCRELAQYCREARIEFAPEHPGLGLIPQLANADAVRPLIERLVGVHMGANRNKGLSFNWIIDHVRDGLGKAHPRALVRLIEEAAAREKEQPRAQYQRILHPTSLRRAIEEVSKHQVMQAINNEWPWMEGLRDRLQNEGIPMPRRKFEGLLRKEWTASWNRRTEARPPAEDPARLTDDLIELGIIRARGSDRVDVPDLYQVGLRLVRKGGVRRA